jgi:hypothetical protein
VIAKFTELELPSQNSFGGDSLNSLIPEIVPVWEEAGKSTTKSGQEVIIVPLKDESLRELNKGNVDCKLLFSKTSKNAVETSLLVYIPDSTYAETTGGQYKLEEFTGFFLFLNLQQQLKYGFYLEKGTPVALVESISEGVVIGSTDDRACCEIKETTVNYDCSSEHGFSSIICQKTIRTLVCCNEVNDPSNGGGNGNAGGSGSGGGGGGGYGNSGNPYNPTSGNSEPVNPFFDAMSYYNGSMPLGIFQTLGSYVPEGLTFEAINMFLSIKQDLWNMGISGSTMEWILNHADYIPILHQVLTGPQDGEEQETLGAIFSFAHAHNLTASQFEYLVKHPELKEQIQKFLTANNNTKKAEDFAKFAIDLIEQDPETKWERLEELYELVENNPDALVNCTNNSTNPLFPISEWNDLASFVPPTSVMNALENVPGNWNIQEISNASGTKVNLDYFSSVVNTLPTIDGQQLSADEFISYIRKNINTFVDNTSFNPYRPSDGVLWQSDNPLSAVITITIMPDNGSVITSSFDNCCWVFTTIHAPLGSDGTHPVSGNRQFGYKVNPNGTFEFYTKGADRLTTWFHNLIEPLAFNGADNLWESFQDHIKDFVNSHNGVSNVQIQFNNRPDWDKVKEMLTKDYPITSIPCH